MSCHLTRSDDVIICPEGMMSFAKKEWHHFRKTDDVICQKGMALFAK